VVFTEDGGPRRAAALVTGGRVNLDNLFVTERRA
jgi:hypothetical protein